MKLISLMRIYKNSLKKNYKKKRYYIKNIKKKEIMAQLSSFCIFKNKNYIMLIKYTVKSFQ